MTGGEQKKSLARNLLLTCALTPLLAAQAIAAEKQQFNLPAGDASKSVQMLARQSGLQIFAPKKDLADVESNAVTGEYEPVDALRLMLEGTGLVLMQTNDDTVTIKRAPSATRSAQIVPASAVGAQEAAANEADIETVDDAEGEETALTDDPDRIVVTGSRIRRPGYDTLETAIVTDERQIELRGYDNIIQALDDTPGFISSGVNPIGEGQAGLTSGQSFSNFLGLGSQRTLTLVNGRRFVSSNTISGSGVTASPGQQVDLNLIPIGLVKRIETIAIGGAPIYGSDAIAGTVNVILKDNYEGLELNGQYGVTDEGDGESYMVQALGGVNFAEDRGNIALSAQYSKQEGMLLSDRAGSHRSLPNLLGDPARIVSEDLVFASMTEGGLPFNADFSRIVDGSGTPLQFGPNGELAPFTFGDPLNGLVAAGLTDGGDGVRHADHLSLLSPTERILLNGFGHYDLTDDIRIVAEVSYARSEGEEISELAQFADPFQVGTVIPVTLDNAFLSADTVATLTANGAPGLFFLSRNFSDLIERGSLSQNEIDVFRAVAGVEGDFTLFDGPASWNVAFNYGRSRGEMSMRYINDDRFRMAVNAVRDTEGNIVCADTLSADPQVALAAQGCVPLNIFGVNAFSDEAADYVTERGTNVSLNQQYVVTANLSGELPVRISTESVAFNIGAEYRRESGDFDTNSPLNRDLRLFRFPDYGLPGFVYANAFRGDSGSFNTKEVYGELSIPVVSPDQGLPVVKSFSVDTAARYVDHSIAGGDVTWSAGGRFAPRLPGVLDGLLFRGVYTEAIRSPAITELFSGDSPTRGSITDPCGVDSFQEGPNPAVREANCRDALAALGITPEAFVPTTFALSASGTVSGNRDLENEQAQSWSAGLVYQPEMIEGFRLSVDWSHIMLTNGIERLGIGTLISACYDSADFPNIAACDSFRRLTMSEAGPSSANPVRVTGDIADGYNSGYVNTSSREVAALFISAEYAFGIDKILPSWSSNGEIQLGGNVLHNHKFIALTTDSSPIANEVGSVGLPDWSGQFNVGYSDDRFDVLFQGLWTGAVQIDPFASEGFLADEDQYIDNNWRFNGTLGFRPLEGVKLQLAVNNIFDNEPSKAQIFSRDFGTYDLIGRTFLISTRVEF